MDEAARLQYLKTMGIQVWVPRVNNSVNAVLPENQEDGRDSLQCADSVKNVNRDWESLETEVSACRKCTLCETRNNTVFGVGNKFAEWMIIGEAPGQHEDEQGKPFVGRAGQLLTEMLRAVGLERDDVFITNILKCRPPGNRDPKLEEAESCNDFLRRQCVLVKPKIILAVGRISAQTLLKTDAPLAKLRGKVHKLNDIPLVVVYHPAYLLRSLLEKRKAWQDLQLARQIIGER